VLSGRGLCDELITRSEKSYRLWYVVVCDLEKQTSWMRMPRSTRGLSPQEKKYVLNFVWGLKVNFRQTTQHYFGEDRDDRNSRNNFKYYRIIVTIIIILPTMCIRHTDS